MAKILMSFHHYPISTGRYVSAALRRLGHDVRTVGEPIGTNTGWGDRHCREDQVHHPDHADAGHVFEGWQPDFVLKTDPFTPKDWRHPAYDVPHYMYNTCNAVTNLDHPAHDHMFIAHYHSRTCPYQDNGRYTWLPNAYDPVYHTPSSIPWSERKYDVVFVGAYYRDRKAVVEALGGAGLTCYVGRGPILHDYTAIYHNARFAVVSSTHMPNGASMRFFENARHGSLVLSGPCADKHLFDPPVDGFLWYESTAHAVEMAKYYLSQPAQAEAVIRLSVAWAAPHTWDARAAAIVAKHRELTA